MTTEYPQWKAGDLVRIASGTEYDHGIPPENRFAGRTGKVNQVHFGDEPWSWWEYDVVFVDENGTEVGHEWIFYHSELEAVENG